MEQAGQQEQGEQEVPVASMEVMSSHGDSRFRPQLCDFLHSSILVPYWLNEYASRKIQE